MVLLMRKLLPILLAFLGSAVYGDLVRYHNYEYGLGYRDDGGAYKLHGIGVYVTYSDSELPTGWGTYNGATVVLAGTYDPQLLTDFFGVTYKSSFMVYDNETSQINNTGLGYTGSSWSSSDGHVNSPSQSPALGGLGKIISDGGMGSHGGGLGLGDYYFNGVVDGNDNILGGELQKITDNGNDYQLVNVNTGSVDDSWNKSLGNLAPITYKDGSGNTVTGWYNPLTGEIQTSNPNIGGGGTTNIVDLSSINLALHNVTNNQNLLRQQLVQQLGAAGNSWVYDCKLSLSELLTLAQALKIEVNSTMTSEGTLVRNSLATVHTDLTGIDGKLGTANTTLSDIKSTLNSFRSENRVVISGINTTASKIDNNLGYFYGEFAEHRFWMYDYIEDIISKLNDIKNNTTATSGDFLNLPQPNLSNEPTADSELPFSWDGWASNAQQSFNTLVSWGADPRNGFPLDFDILSRFLTVAIGQIPSVGSDPHMFDVSFDLPYIGLVQKSFNFSDYPSITIFRTVCLWILYVFFGIASFKLIHGSII